MQLHVWEDAQLDVLKESQHPSHKAPCPLPSSPLLPLVTGGIHHLRWPAIQSPLAH